MRQIFHITLAALASVALFAACSKVEPVDETPAVKVMTIKATISDAATRVTFDPVYGSDSKPTSMGHTWQAGDKLRITDASDATKTALFDLVDGAGSATGTFEGNGFEAASYNVEAVPQGSFSSGFTQTQAKDGATDHLQFVATATGVTDLSSFTLAETSGIVGVIAKLPKDVAGTITALEIEAKVTGLPMPIKVTVNLTAQEDVDSDDILKIYANAPTGFAIPAGAEVFLRFKSNNPDHTVYTRYQQFDSNLLPVPGKFNYVKFNCKDIDKFAGAGNDGSSADPYQIADKYQMDAVHELLVADETVCFQMVDDVDMSGITWVPLNNVTDDNKHYSKYISFDGDNHTLSNITTDAAEIPAYPSVFGVLNGEVANLNIDHATITPGGNKAGVLAGYIGSSDSVVIPSVTNVHITNSTVGTSDNRATNYIGGVAAQIQKDGTTLSNVSIESSSVYGDLANKKTCGGMIAYIKSGATLEKCHSAALVDGQAYVGGIVGFPEAPEGKSIVISKCYYDGPGVISSWRYVGGVVGHTNGAGTLTIQDCYATSKVTAAGGWAGGISGDHYKGTTRIYNCYATAEVSASFGAGGIVGQVNVDNLDIQKCAAFNAAIVATSTDEAEHYSSGAVVAYAKDKKMTINTTYHQAGMSFTECPGNTGNTLPASNTGINWLDNETVAQGNGQYIYTYHGRRTTMTLVALTRDNYGWDANVWDFSGDVPTLK